MPYLSSITACGYKKKARKIERSNAPCTIFYSFFFIKSKREREERKEEQEEEEEERTCPGSK